MKYRKYVPTFESFIKESLMSRPITDEEIISNIEILYQKIQNLQNKILDFVVTPGEQDEIRSNYEMFLEDEGDPDFPPEEAYEISFSEVIESLYSVGQLLRGYDSSHTAIENILNTPPIGEDNNVAGVVLLMYTYFFSNNKMHEMDKRDPQVVLNYLFDVLDEVNKA